MGGSASATILESWNIGRRLSHASRRGLALIRRNDMHAILFVAVANSCMRPEGLSASTPIVDVQATRRHDRS